MAVCPRHDYPGDPEYRAYREDCHMCRLEKMVARFMPKEPNWRYIDVDGWMYCWSTERMGDGKFAAFIYKPVGPGARTGKAERWKVVKELHFTKRSTAKARAEKWAATASNRPERLARKRAERAG